MRVKRSGTYDIYALYGGATNTIRLDVDGKPASDCKLPLNTGSPRVWNKALIGEITFPSRGVHILTPYYGKENMHNNLAYLEFVQAKHRFSAAVDQSGFRRSDATGGVCQKTKKSA